jgi:ActR/RegA family two-component response regulator
MSMEYARVLFVDDEESIRIMLPAVLQQHGFKVRTAASVAEALVEINAAPFDVLICDLNLDKPGDGFLVLAAMRHLHPQCVNLILTGYPAFETAVEAMHNQVDDYLVKPADITLLLSTIERKLASRKDKRAERVTRLPELLRDSGVRVAELAATAIEHHPDLSAVMIDGAERLQHLTSFVTAATHQLENNQNKPSDQQLKMAFRYGQTRKAARYTVSMVVTEFQILDEAISTLARNNLPNMGIAALFYDYSRLHTLLGAFMLKALEAFETRTLGPGRKTRRGTVASD